MQKIKLTESQKRALSKLSPTEWKSSYELGENRRVLDSLVRHGWEVKRVGLGAGFSPRTEIKYKLGLEA